MEIEEKNIEFIIEKGVCEICKDNEFKYKCPGCLKKSCSLKCVNFHKEKFKCNGKKPKFSSKHIKQFEEKELYQDLRYMTEMINDTNRANKTLFNLTEADQKRLKEKKQKNFKKLCKKFRNVNLELCPTVLTRFNENKSYCDSKQRKFYWTVKFNFFDRDKFISLIKSTPFDDSIHKLHQILSTCLDDKINLSLDLMVFLKDNNICDWNRLIILFKLQDRSSKNEVITINNIKYEECDKTLLLKDFLGGKTIYEYPEFYVLNK